MNDIFRYRQGSFQTKKITPQEAGKELEKIRNKNKGMLTPLNVLDAARDKKSPLHIIFEWDDTKAAEKYRKVQASTLICSIVIKPQESEPERRYFASIKPMGEGKAAYLPTSIAVENPYFRNQLIQKAIDDLEAAKKKYGHLAQFEKVFKMFEKTKEELMAEEKKEEKILTVRATKGK